MSRALATLLVVASLALVVVQTLHLPLSSRLQGVIDAVVVAAAMLSLGFAAAWRGGIDDTPQVSTRTRAALAVCAPVLAVVATFVHHRGFRLYDSAVALMIGAIIGMLATRATSPEENVERRVPAALLVGALVAAVAGRFLIGATFVQTWLLSPLFVLVLPGIALTFALLPSSTDWGERLCWAPPLSVGSQIVSLLWLDWLGVSASLTVFVVVATAITVLAIVAARWSVPLPRAESAP